jgi:hypothetical protein
MKTTTLVTAIALLVVPNSSADRWDVRREIAEGNREIRRERREAVREILSADSRREIREAYKEINREKREQRREVRREVRQSQWGW